MWQQAGKIARNMLTGALRFRHAGAFRSRHTGAFQFRHVGQTASRRTNRNLTHPLEHKKQTTILAIMAIFRIFSQLRCIMDHCRSGFAVVSSTHVLVAAARFPFCRWWASVSSFSPNRTACTVHITVQHSRNRPAGRTTQQRRISVGGFVAPEKRVLYVRILSNSGFQPGVYRATVRFCTVTR